MQTAAEPVDHVQPDLGYRRGAQHEQEHGRPEQRLEGARNPVQCAWVDALHPRDCQSRAGGAFPTNHFPVVGRDDAVRDELACDQVADVVRGEAAALGCRDFARDVVQRVLPVSALGNPVQRPRQLNVAFALTLHQPRWIDERAFPHLPGQPDSRREVRSVRYFALELVESGRGLGHHS